MSYELIVYDFDGTLYDSFRGISKAFSESSEMIYGYPMELNRINIGPKLKEIYASKFMDSFKYPQFEKIFRELYDNKYCFWGEFYDGVNKIINTLKENSISQGIISNKPQHVIQSILMRNEIETKFDFILGSKIDINISKSELLKNQLNIKKNYSPEKVLVFGDTIEDYTMAKENGCDFLFASYGYGKMEFQNLKAAKLPLNILDIIDNYENSGLHS